MRPAVIVPRMRSMALFRDSPTGEHADQGDVDGRPAGLFPVHVQGDSVGNGDPQPHFERINGFSG